MFTNEERNEIYQSRNWRVIFGDKAGKISIVTVCIGDDKDKAEKRIKSFCRDNKLLCCIIGITDNLSEEEALAFMKRQVRRFKYDCRRLPYM